jgi:hypothetical protein
MQRRRSYVRIAGLTLTLAGTGCAEDPQIVCTPGSLKACFGIEVIVRPVGGNDTRVTIHVQNLQGTIADDNTAWSQLLYLRVYRNMEPALGFPVGGDVVPTWDPAVTTIGPGAAGSGWRNVGVNSPEFVSEWVASGGTCGADVGYLAGRNETCNEVAGAGAGFRTFSGVGSAPGWVTFSFLAGQRFTISDVGVQLAAWASDQAASGRPAPQSVGCQVIRGGGPLSTDCIFLPYNLN